MVRGAAGRAVPPERADRRLSMMRIVVIVIFLGSAALNFVRWQRACVGRVGGVWSARRRRWAQH